MSPPPLSFSTPPSPRSTISNTNSPPHPSSLVELDAILAAYTQQLFELEDVGVGSEDAAVERLQGEIRRLKFRYEGIGVGSGGGGSGNGNVGSMETEMDMEMDVDSDDHGDGRNGRLETKLGKQRHIETNHDKDQEIHFQLQVQQPEQQQYSKQLQKHQKQKKDRDLISKLRQAMARHGEKQQQQLEGQQEGEQQQTSSSGGTFPLGTPTQPPAQLQMQPQLPQLFRLPQLPSMQELMQQKQRYEAERKVELERLRELERGKERDLQFRYPILRLRGRSEGGGILSGIGSGMGNGSGENGAKYDDTLPGFPAQGFDMEEASGGSSVWGRGVGGGSGSGNGSSNGIGNGNDNEIYQNQGFVQGGQQFRTPHVPGRSVSGVEFGMERMQTQGQGQGRTLKRTMSMNSLFRGKDAEEEGRRRKKGLWADGRDADKAEGGEEEEEQNMWGAFVDFNDEKEQMSRDEEFARQVEEEYTAADYETLRLAEMKNEALLKEDEVYARRVQEEERDAVELEVSYRRNMQASNISIPPQKDPQLQIPSLGQGLNQVLGQGMGVAEGEGESDDVRYVLRNETFSGMDLDQPQVEAGQEMDELGNMWVGGNGEGSSGGGDSSSVGGNGNLDGEQKDNPWFSLPGVHERFHHLLNTYGFIFPATDRLQEGLPAATPQQMSSEFLKAFELVPPKEEANNEGGEENGLDVLDEDNAQRAEQLEQEVGPVVDLFQPPPFYFNGQLPAFAQAQTLVQREGLQMQIGSNVNGNDNNVLNNFPGYLGNYINLPEVNNLAAVNPLPRIGGTFAPFGALIERNALPNFNNLLNNLAAPVAGPLGQYMDYVRSDPTKTVDEIRALLANIRPDMDIPPENREGTPEALVYPLMEHQKLGLAWMKAMEEGSNKGGILADDMGLGKTIQALALIVARPPPKGEKKCKTNLIVAPLSLLKQWEREIEKKVKKEFRLETYIHHGQTKKYKTFKELRKFDVVLTTFGTIATEYRRKQAYLESKKDDADAVINEDEYLFTGKKSTWYRVIIDEAQCIKNRETLGAKGCADINALYRFCLSGTPMQNRIEEIYSLIRFLRIKPYSDWTNFSRDFSKPFKSRNITERNVKELMKRFQALLNAFLLRRTKSSQIDGRPILTLPAKTIEVVHSVFSPDEQMFYDALKNKTLLQFNKYLRMNSIGKNYSNILVLLLRMRQACCHPHLINDIEVGGGEVSEDKMMKLAKDLPKAAVTRLKESGIEECPICMDTSNNPSIVLPCGHGFCNDCIVQVYTTSTQQNLARGDEQAAPRCPGCRGNLDIKKMIDWKTFRKVYMKDELEAEELDEVDIKGKKSAARVMNSDELAKLRRDSRRNAASKREYIEYLEEHWMPSAKITKCLEILEGIERKDPTEKTIIFSQWTSLLDLLEVPIFRKNWGYRRYDGTMTSTERNDAIIDFTDDPRVNIMLVSLKAGNSGLNLVAASQVILFDPCYNPYVEDQAIDRAHRIGQQREVVVHKLCVQGTVEDKVLALQEEKKRVIGCALDEKASKGIARLGARDLAFLFGIDGAQLAQIQ